MSAAEPQKRLQEDPLEIIRIATEVSRGGGNCPAPEIGKLCAAAVEALDGVDPAEVGGALTECLMGRDVDVALEWLQEIGFVVRFLPELEATRHLRQEPGRHHKDVWEHTKLVVKQAVMRPRVRWAALLHDIGKVPTRRFTDTGVHFHGHAEVGARMYDRICARVPFERDDRSAIRFLIKHHLRSAQYDEAWTDGAVRRFYREMDAHLPDLLDLSRADITSKRPGRRRSLLFQISALSDRIDALRATDSVVPPLPKGLGNALMEHFELPPSKLLGDLRKAIEAAVERGEIEPHKDCGYYVDYVARAGLISSLKS